MKITANINNFNINNTSYTKRPSFGANPYNVLIDKTAQGFAKMANNKHVISIIDKIAPHDPVSILTATTGMVIGLFYLINTAKSKKIEQEQKRPLMINMGLVTTVSTILGLFINKKLDKKILAFENYFKDHAKDKDLAGCVKGIRPAAKLLTFVAIYRYLSPVLITPIANKISNALTDKEKANKRILDKKA